MRVCSFNIRYDNSADGDAWPRRRGLAARVLEAIDADIIGLQECLPSQADDLRAALPGYAFFGAGRDDGVHGEMVPLLIREGFAEVIEAGHFWLSESPHIPGSRGFGAALPRLCSWAALRLSGAPSAPLWVFNAHLDHISAGARRGACELLSRRIEALGDAIPVLLMGDLNAEPLAPELAPLFRLTGRARLVDAAQGLGGSFHGFTGRAQGPRIDWVIANEHLPVRSARLDQTSEGGRYPSDHFPLVVELGSRGAL